MKRELGAFTHRPDKEKKASYPGNGGQFGVTLKGSQVDGAKVPSSQGNTNQDGAEYQTHIGQLVDQEGLVARLHVGKVFPIEPNQEVRREADTLPPNDQLDQVGCTNEDQHGTGE